MFIFEIDVIPTTLIIWKDFLPSLEVWAHSWYQHPHLLWCLRFIDYITGPITILDESTGIPHPVFGKYGTQDRKSVV